MATAIYSGYRISEVFMQSIAVVHDIRLGSQVPPFVWYGAWE